MKANKDVFHDVFTNKPHHVSTMSPLHVQGFDLLEGDIGTVGSKICWTYTIDGEKKISKQILETIDHENKVLTLKEFEGDVTDKYDSYKVTLHIETKDEIDLVCWTLEYERPNENVPELISVLNFIVEMVKVLLEAFPQLSVTFDQSNSTALHTASAQGHIEVVNFLLETNSSLATIPKNNGKTTLHSTARNGHVAVVKALLSRKEGILNWRDKKGQTTLHMAVKVQSVDVVNERILSDPTLATIIDRKGNTALPIAMRKGRVEIVQALVKDKRMKWDAINKPGETALVVAEKARNSEIAAILKEHGVLTAKNMKLALPTRSAKELKQIVSDIKHDVHNQLEHTFQTQKRVKNIAKSLNKMHTEGLNNAINSTTVIVVLIATVTFAAIFNLPGQYTDNLKEVPPGYSIGEGRIAPQPPFCHFLHI
ncbi:hypothetical protein KY285_037580 [Solanum tuberosum]|nr:hypothetical protein KY285_037580 [Solanum tuberosum]